MSRLKLLFTYLILSLGKFCNAQITSPAPYCGASYDDAAGFPVDHYISNVSLGTLTNTTGAVQFAAPHYAYYNAIAAPSLTQGTPYTISITHDGGASIHFVAAYIDFNHNNSFADPGEKILQQTISTGGTISNPATASITIPASAVVGVTRMRVMVFEDDQYTWTAGNTNATPCTADASGTLDWGETEDYNVNIVASSSGCTSVTGLTASSITTTGATLSWSAATGSIGYEYVVNTTAADPTGAGTFVSGTSVTVGSLAPATTYYAHVRNKCSSTSFSGWITQSFTTLPIVTVCDTASALTVSGITSSGANLSWTGVGGSIGYEYIVNMSAGAPTGSGTLTTATAATAAGLTASTNYYAHVRNKCSATSFSSWITRPFTTLPATCDTTGGIVISGISGTGATISWSAVPGAVGYEYLINTSATAPSGIGTGTTATAATTTSLLPSTLYYAHIRTVCAGGLHSAWTTRSFMTITPCNPPTGLTVSGISTTGATISWTAVSGSLGYEYAVTGAPTPPASSVSTIFTTVSFAALTPESTYYAHVRNKCGGSNTSTWITQPFRTTLAVDNVGNTPITVTANPNPVNNALNIAINGSMSEHAKIQLTDLAGRTIMEMTVTEQHAQLNMEKLERGIYFIRYSDTASLQMIKILKQ